MDNEILCNRICKMIGISYAISEQEVVGAYNQLGSLDILLTVLKQSVLDKRSLQQALKDYNNGNTE